MNNSLNTISFVNYEIKLTSIAGLLSVGKNLFNEWAERTTAEKLANANNMVGNMPWPGQVLLNRIPGFDWKTSKERILNPAINAHRTKEREEYKKQYESKSIDELVEIIKGLRSGWLNNDKSYSQLLAALDILANNHGEFDFSMEHVQRGIEAALGLPDGTLKDDPFLTEKAYDALAGEGQAAALYAATRRKNAELAEEKKKEFAEDPNVPEARLIELSIKLRQNRDKSEVTNSEYLQLIMLAFDNGIFNSNLLLYLIALGVREKKLPSKVITNFVNAEGRGNKFPALRYIESIKDNINQLDNMIDKIDADDFAQDIRAKDITKFPGYSKFFVEHIEADPAVQNTVINIQDDLMAKTTPEFIGDIFWNCDSDKQRSYLKKSIGGSDKMNNKNLTAIYKKVFEYGSLPAGPMSDAKLKQVLDDWYEFDCDLFGRNYEGIPPQGTSYQPINIITGGNNVRARSGHQTAVPYHPYDATQIRPGAFAEYRELLAIAYGAYKAQGGRGLADARDILTRRCFDPANNIPPNYNFAQDIEILNLEKDANGNINIQNVSQPYANTVSIRKWP